MYNILLHKLYNYTHKYHIHTHHIQAPCTPYTNNTTHIYTTYKPIHKHYTQDTDIYNITYILHKSHIPHTSHTQTYHIYTYHTHGTNIHTTQVTHTKFIPDTLLTHPYTSCKYSYSSHIYTINIPRPYTLCMYTVSYIYHTHTIIHTPYRCTYILHIAHNIYHMYI